MPIIPVYEPQNGIPTLHQSAPGIEAFPAYNQSKLGAQVAEGAMSVGVAAAQIAGKKKRVDDITTVADRQEQWLKGSSEDFDSLQLDRGKHSIAPDEWNRMQADRMQEATKDLRPDLASKVKSGVMRQQITYTSHARVLQNTARIEDAKATLDIALQNEIEQSARLNTVTDAQAMEGVDSSRGAVAGALTGNAGEIKGGGVTTNPKASAEAPPGRYEALVQDYVKAGVYSEAQGIELLKKARPAVAASRANAMAIDAPQGFLDLVDQEKKQKDSTFLGLMDPTVRGRLAEQAQERIHKLEDAAYTRERRQYQARDEMEKKTSADVQGWFAQQIEDPKTHGSLDPANLDLALKIRAITDTDYTNLKHRLFVEQVQGGPGVPAVIKRQLMEGFDASIPAKDRLAALRKRFDRGDIDRTTYQTFASTLSAEAKAESLDRVNPQLRQNTIAAQQQVTQQLKANNILGTLDDSSQVEENRLHAKLYNNMMSSNPEAPQAIIDREMAGAQARVSSATGNLGENLAAARRSALGMPVRGKPAENQTSLAAKKAELQAAYSAAKTPAERARIEGYAREVNTLEALERALVTQGARAENLNTNSPNTPGVVNAPKRPN